MKKLFLYPIIGILVLIVISSCKTKTVQVNLLVPAQINVPQHIQNVGILNHSLADKDQKWVNILEGFITGESIFADKQASSTTLKGCSNKLNNSPRFKSVLLENENFKGTGTKQFPQPLDWNDVEYLCSKYNIDAIISLETFDSDIRTRGGVELKKETKDGNIIEYNEHWVDLNIRTNAGWRIYDNKNKKIIDENVFIDEKVWHAMGNSNSEAMSKLPPKRNAVDDAGYFSGEMYAVRISPNWIWSPRTYYHKGNDDFKRANKLVELNDWKGVAEIWKKHITSSDMKIAGRSCHNMAFAAEMEGNLQTALEWATKAYTNFNLKNEIEYINILKRRINDQERLKNQLE